MGKFMGRLSGVWKLAAVYLVTFLWGLAAIVAGFFDPGGIWVHRRIARSWARIVLFLVRIRLEVEGLEILSDEPGPYVLVVNHQSLLDIPVLVWAIPLQLRFLAKLELSRIPVFGSAAARAGHIFLDRSDHEQSMKAVRKAAREVSDLGVSVVFAAEGTRSADGKLGSFKKGAFVMALEAGLPILPVIISGTRFCLPKGSLMARKGTVRVVLLPPVHTGHMTYGERDSLKNRVREGMAKELERLDR